MNQDLSGSNSLPSSAPNSMPNPISNPINNPSPNLNSPLGAQNLNTNSSANSASENSIPVSAPSPWSQIGSTPAPSPLASAPDLSPAPGAPEQTPPSLTQPQPIPYKPIMTTPATSSSNNSVMILLAIIILLGGLGLAIWLGWIKIDFITKYFVKKTPPTSTIETPQAKDPALVRDLQRKNDLINLKFVLKEYYNLHQSYPISKGTEKTSDDKGSLQSLIPEVTANLPVDPISPTYYYAYQSDGKTFTLTAVLESNENTDGIVSGQYLLYKVTDSSTEEPVSGSDLAQ